MDKLKICFVGIGSIAKRHICNIRQVCHNRDIMVIVDAFRRCFSSSLPDGVDYEYSSLEDMPNDYDVIFITNPTEYHLETLEKFHHKGHHFFIEKPLVSIHQLERAKRFKRRNKSIYYVACPLRYNAVIQYIKSNIDPSDVISVRSISSSYLPDWRPGQDYRKTYSAHKAFGGGVSIDLIHEWDYLTYLFGMPVNILCSIGKKSDLEIDSDDYAVYIGEMRDKIVELHLDYFGRSTIREIQLITKEDTIIGDIVGSNIRWLKTGRFIEFHEERDDYQRRELEYFLDLISGTEKTTDDYNNAIRVLNMTQGIVQIIH